jgi:hypothetical protein
MERANLSNVALGDPEQDLLVATIIFLVDSRLVLLRPRRVSFECMCQKEGLAQLTLLRDVGRQQRGPL